MIVKILCGGYGKHENGHVVLIGCGQTVDVSSDEGERLISLNLAEAVDEEDQTQKSGNGVRELAHPAPESNAGTSASGDIPETGQDESNVEDPSDEIDLNELSAAELRSLAKEFGLNPSARQSKASMIEMIMNAQAPTLGLEDPV